MDTHSAIGSNGSRADLTFGKWVKQRRKQLDLTQIYLADKVGCAVITLQKIEAGTLRPSGQIAKLLAAALKIPQDDREHFLEAARAVTPPATKPKEPGLAVAASQLLGRERDLIEICRVLALAEVRLLTLLGPPGVGKTRLAMELAAQHATRLPGMFVDGVVFVSLAEVQDANLVMQALARALNLKDSATHASLVQLQQALRDKHMLLVLDNFEHVLPAAAALETLLDSTNGIKLLITSRTLLKVSVERNYPVVPLELPDRSHLPTGARLAQHAAVALFVERAKQASPAFALTAANGSAIAQICIQLDGLPLAIELAAAHCRFLSPAALLQRLEHRLPLLESRSASLPARQRRLHDAIAWSYEQLEPEEQTVFNRLGVFVGGWTTDAAEVICNADEAFAPVVGILDQLATLLDHSLIAHRMFIASTIANATSDTALSDEHGDEPRFTMLETLREFALEKLAVSGELDEVRRRHAAYFVKVARDNEMEMSGSRQAEVLQLLETAHDNIRAALRWALVHEPVTALELCGRLHYFWQLRSYFSEGRSWLEQALAATAALMGTDAHRLSLRARALNGAGALAYRQSDYEHAAVLLRECITLCQRLEDEPMLASALNQLGNVQWDQSDLNAAWETYSQALALARELDNPTRLAAILSNMGSLAWYRRELDTAQKMLEESLLIRRKMGDRDGLATALTNLGGLMLTKGDVQQALLFQRESLAIFRQLDSRQGMAMVMGNLANTLQEANEPEQAQHLYDESLAIRREIGDRWGEASALGHLGKLARQRGDYGQAIAVLQDSLTIMRQLNDRWFASRNLNDLGDTAWAMGNLAQARDWHTEALALQREMDDKPGLLNSLAGFADIAAASGQTRLAAQLWGAVEMCREQLGEKLSPREAAEWETQLEATRQIDAAAFDAARQDGRSLSLDAAIRLVAEPVAEP